jgi:UDP-N-acetylmuramate dehydrogenase
VSLGAAVAALEAAGCTVERGASLARLGWWRLGGPAGAFAVVDTPAQLAAALAPGPAFVLGNGSNLLVSDRGVSGLVLRLGAGFRATAIEGPPGARVAVVGGGLPNAVLLQRLSRLGLGGLGALAGVPGTVGGAIRMNAGTALGEIGPRVRWVDLALPGGETARLPGEALGFAYRHATLPPGALVTAAALAVDDAPDAVAAEAEAMAHHLARRRATQPLDQPSCGSVFKNPPGDHAGRLIESVGLKGHAVGGARISPLHANFIVNTGGATAADVLALIRLARGRVHAAAGVVLAPEVHAVGEFGPGEWPLPPP